MRRRAAMMPSRARAAALAFVVGVAAAVASGSTGAAAARSAGVIVFASTRSGSPGLYAIRPDGTHVLRLAAAGEEPEPRLSPDGGHAVFSGSGYSLRVLDLATGKRHVLPGPPSLGLGWAGTSRPWAGDSSRFAVGADDGLRVFAADGTLSGGYLFTMRKPPRGRPTAGRSHSRIKRACPWSEQTAVG